MAVCSNGGVAFSHDFHRDTVPIPLLEILACWSRIYTIYTVNITYEKVSSRIVQLLSPTYRHTHFFSCSSTEQMASSNMAVEILL